MIITCAECATQFQLDDDRIPQSGVRVRCSVCKHAFFVAHPDEIEVVDADPVARVVQQVLDGEPGAVPDPAEDLDAPRARAAGVGPPEDGLEGSWEFSDGGRLSDPSRRDRFEESFEAAREAVEDLLGSPSEPPKTASARPVETPVETLFDSAFETPGESAFENAFETPGESAFENAFETPGASAFESELEAPGESAFENAFETPGESAFENPFEASVETPAETPFAPEPPLDLALDAPEDSLLETPERWDELRVPERQPEPSPLGLADDPWDTGPGWPSDAAPADAQEPDAIADRGPEPAVRAEPSAAAADIRDPGDFDPFGPDLVDEEDPGRAASDLPATDELELDDEGDPYEGSALAEALDALDAAEDDDLGSFAEDPSGGDAARAFGAPAAREQAAPEDRDLGDPLGRPEFAGAARAAAEPLPLGLFGGLEPEPRGGRALAWLARAGGGIGWGVVTLLAAVTLWGSVAPRSAPPRVAGVQALAGLEAAGVVGRWVENANLGALYVVSGELHNPGPETRVPGVRMVVRLLDAEGAPIREAAASLGPPRGALLLREARAEALLDAEELGALDLARRPVAPGARIAFEAVVIDMPDAAQRFELAALPIRAGPQAGS